MAHPDKTPPINATGTYTLREPWTTVPGAVYKCEGISGFEALEADGVDVYRRFYQPNGISLNEMLADANAGINIITLMSRTAETIYVPSSYIISYPNDIAAGYSRMLVATDVGPLPDWQTLDELVGLFSLEASRITGQTCTTKVIKVPMDGFYSSAESKAMEEARKLAMETNENPIYGKIKVDKQLESAKNKGKALLLQFKDMIS